MQLQDLENIFLILEQLELLDFLGSQHMILSHPASSHAYL